MTETLKPVPKTRRQRRSHLYLLLGPGNVRDTLRSIILVRTTTGAFFRKDGVPRLGRKYERGGVVCKESSR